MTKTVSAYEARTKLGELMNLVYYNNIDIIVEKMGKPIVKIVRIEENNNTANINEKLASYAGAWGSDAAVIQKDMNAFRKDFTLTSHI